MSRRRFQVADLARYRVRSPILRLLGFKVIAVRVTSWLSMGDHPDYDYTIRPLGRLGTIWPWTAIEASDEELIPFDAVSALGDLAR